MSISDEKLNRQVKVLNIEPANFYLNSSFFFMNDDHSQPLSTASLLNNIKMNVYLVE